MVDTLTPRQRSERMALIRSKGTKLDRCDETRRMRGMRNLFTFYEFFAGGGMARAGLGPQWECLFANDFDSKKAATYIVNWGGAALKVDDVARTSVTELPGTAHLAWASFPCQDLSLAGYGTGLNGARSGSFWPFWRLMRALAREERAPRTIVLENVYGAVTSHQGKDLAAICEALSKEGYRYAPLVIDAQHFLPQSRPRLFILAFSHDAVPPLSLVRQGPEAPWHPDSFGLAYNRLTDAARAAWLWLYPPVPPGRRIRLADLIEDEPTSVKWHSAAETQRLLSMMTPANLEKVKQAKKARQRMIGALYKRTRVGKDGIKRQRAEVRFDDTAGCLRTPAGGSSRQIILVVEGNRIRSRLLSPREAARLMGLPEHYVLPDRYNDAYHLAGDGVAVPVVSWIARHVIEPSLKARAVRKAA